MRYLKAHPIKVGLWVVGILVFLWLLMQFGVFGSNLERGGG